MKSSISRLLPGSSLGGSEPRRGSRVKMRWQYAYNKTATKAATVLLIAMMFAAFPSNGQQVKPSNSGYAPVNGIKVYYEVYGEGSPIVLLHGAFYTIDMNWSQLIPALSKTRKVIAIEMQGHGHTPFSDRKLSLTDLASDVEGVMDYLKIDSADVAGFSMGGSVAYQFAVQSPKRLRKLVIISSTYKTSGWLPAVNSGFKNFKPELFDNTPIKAAYDAVAPDKTKWRKFLQQMFSFAAEPFNVGDSNISKIAAPVLIISGDNDGLDKVELMKTYQLLGGGVSADLQPMPASQLAIVPSQGHVSLMMQTTTILNYLDGFLN
jgi:pimeloyl-ACP methyl ester carboxylesterase